MRLAILTSGGDAPGMNAAIRSSVRVAKSQNWTVFGVRRGYRGLIYGELDEMGSRSVSNIIQRGGTILRSSRCKEFETDDGLQQAKRTLEAFGVQGLIVIGGDGSFRGAVALARIWDGQIIGVPGTIDNDLSGTDYTIGYDTAVNTAVDAIDKIRDTAEAQERYFLVEVMGREAGFIALEAGLSGGAEEIMVPEIHTELAEIHRRLMQGKQRGKTSSILIVAEGNHEGNAFEIANKLKQLCGSEYRVVVLGHIQRGGSPTARDRILATKLGSYAVDVLTEGKNCVMVGEVRGELTTTSLEQTWSVKKSLDPYLLRLNTVLET
jgi:6-phosphofructokinase 1